MLLLPICQTLMVTRDFGTGQASSDFIHVSSSLYFFMFLRYEHVSDLVYNHLLEFEFLLDSDIILRIDFHVLFLVLSKKYSRTTFFPSYVAVSFFFFFFFFFKYFSIRYLFFSWLEFLSLAMWRSVHGTLYNSGGEDRFVNLCPSPSLLCVFVRYRFWFQ
ncbi:Hypothetical predicted protein [Olea europaea subsp. europaea]|nr:Hypothetical predicted protein [Olea europaea subsp. europaea]